MMKVHIFLLTTVRLQCTTETTLTLTRITKRNRLPFATMCKIMAYTWRILSLVYRSADRRCKTERCRFPQVRWRQERCGSCDNVSLRFPRPKWTVGRSGTSCSAVLELSSLPVLIFGESWKWVVYFRLFFSLPLSWIRSCKWAVYLRLFLFF